MILQVSLQKINAQIKKECLQYAVLSIFKAKFKRKWHQSNYRLNRMRIYNFLFIFKYIRKEKKTKYAESS